MTGEKKNFDPPNRLNVKSGKKLLSKTSKPTSSTISSPPKAAIATTSAKKDEVHRRRNPLNDILRRRSGDATSVDNHRLPEKQDVESETASQPSEKAVGVDMRMADRVAELERALVTAREEQKATREELEKARQLSRKDQDTIDELRQQNSHARQDTPESPVASTHERLVSAEDERDGSPDVENNVSIVDSPINTRRSNDDILRQNYDLRCKLAQLQEQLVSHDIAYHNNLDRALSRGDVEWNQLQLRLHATEKESQERLQHLLSLKSSISSLTRADSQVTDSELVDSFAQLFNRIREWIISNFRRTRMDAENVPVETVKVLKSLTPAFESIEKTERLALLQALVSSVLMQVLAEPFLVGLPQAGPMGALKAFADSIRHTGTEFREWRRATIRTIENTEMINTVKQGKIDLLHNIAGEITHLLFTLTSVSLTPTAKSHLMSILNAAVDLQRTIALQKAEYHVLFFRDGSSNTSIDFDEFTMESMNDLDTIVDEDGDISTERHFLFCVFPCLEKFGDELGNNLNVSNVLLRAQVCCRAG